MDRTDRKIDTRLTQPDSRPVRYEIVHKDGQICAPKFQNVQAAVDYARQMWPDQKQDPDRTGNGWDIEIVT